MISKIREWTLPIMIIILVSFVIGTIFLNWGMNRGSGKNSSMAAGSINGHDIPLNYFDREVNAERQKLERGSSAENQYQNHMIPRQVWEQQTQLYLMNNFFKKVNMFASAEEVFDHLKRNPPPGIDTNSALMTNGVFDTGKWIGVLNDPKTFEYNPSFRFLEQRTRELIIPIQKLEVLLISPLLPTRVEMEYVYKSDNERAVFEYAYVQSGSIMFDSSKITDDMVSKYYSAHPDTFKCDEQVDLYVVKFPKKPTAHDEELYLQELMEIKNKIMSEKGAARAEAFAEEAKGMSDDEGSVQNGGDLGFFKKGTMVPEFDSIVFKLDTGIVSNPIKTRFGYHLVFIDKKDKKGKTEQIHARHILRKIVPTIETTDALSENADSLRRTMLDEGFVKAAKEAASRDTSVIFDSTGLFQKSGIVPKAGYISGIGRFAFGGGGRESDLISERLENSSGFYLFSLKQRIAKGIMPLEAAKPRIRQNLADSMRANAARIYAEGWAQKVGEKTSLATLNKKDSTKIISGVTDTVKRISYIPGIGSDSKVAAVAFALPTGKRSGLVEYNGTYFLVRPLWKGPPVFFAWGSNQVEAIAGRLISQTREKIFGDWYMDYLKKQKIISNIDKIYID
jgi:peptidyl-prolyl cis-trans isomerase D